MLSRWRPDQFVEISARQVARAQSVGGMPGCVYMGNAAPEGDGALPAYFVTRSARRRTSALCKRPEMLGSADADNAGRGAGGNRRRADAGPARRRRALEACRRRSRVMLQPLATLQPADGLAVSPVHRDRG